MPRTTICRFSLVTALALALAAAPARAQDARPTTHTVKPGETLWSLARTYLGSPFRWEELYQMNRDVVDNPRALKAGTVLKLGSGAPPAAPSGPVVRIAPSAPPPEPSRRTEPAAEITVTRPAPSAPTEGDGLELFRRKRVSSSDRAMEAYREAKYHPVRSGEFHSGGFMTEGEQIPFGRLLGPVTPEQIETSRALAAVQRFTMVAVTPPAGAQYAPGDSLLVADRREAPVGYGTMIVPTGMLRITGLNGAQAVGEVIAVYGPIREGHVVFPAERFADPGAVDYQQVPAEGALEGRVLIARDLRELRLPQQVLFLDIGRENGVRMGDLFEARRAPGPQARASADAVEERMATFQVIHLRGRTATVTVRGVVSPDVPPGTRVRLIARLPG